MNSPKTTSITKCEILRARCESLLKSATAKELLKSQQRLDRSERLLAELFVAPFDQEAATMFSELVNVKKLKKIEHADLLIYSIALANDATLVTRNMRNFRQVPNLRVENWVD